MIRIFLALIVLAFAIPAQAQVERQQILPMVERAQQIEAVLQGTVAADQVFAPSFLKEVSAEQLKTLAGQLVADNGKIVAIEAVHDQGDGAAVFTLRFEKGSANASFRLAQTSPYRVIGFRIGSVAPLNDTPAKIEADFKQLPGFAGFGIYRLEKTGPELLTGYNSDRQFAVGSTFKLYVLSALAHEIAGHRRRWADVTALGPRSIRSGQMQDWPVRAPVTLQTLATMMISISDNTAADTLIDLLGRKAVEQELRASGHADLAGALPLLKTAELFALKSGEPTRLEAYKIADAKHRRELLARWAPTLDRAHVDVGKLIASDPAAIDSVEWFASPADIGRIFSRLRDLPDHTALDILAINPTLGQQEAGKWAYAGYKGGSEPGVLNLSWLLQSKTGKWYAVSASWNDPLHALDENRLIALGQRLIETLDP